jgi:hypothetical protein
MKICGLQFGCFTQIYYQFSVTDQYISESKLHHTLSGKSSVLKRLKIISTVFISAGKIYSRHKKYPDFNLLKK